MFVMNRRRSVSVSAFLLTPEEVSKGKTPPANANDIAPMFCPIGAWCRLSGFTRSATYKGLAEGWLPSVKIGKTRLIDFYPAIDAVRVRYGTSQAA
jgi:hypothetical protein